MQEYRPDALAAAITQSRAALPRAVDALCDTIAEVSGRAPDRRVVEYVGRLWLMHVCDQLVHGKGHHVASSVATETPMTIVVPQRSLLNVTEIGLRAAIVRRLQTHQYATVLQGDRLTAAHLTNRKASRRDTVLSRFGSSSAQIAITAPYLKVSGGSELRAAWRARRELRWDTDRQP